MIGVKHPRWMNQVCLYTEDLPTQRESVTRSTDSLGCPHRSESAHRQSRLPPLRQLEVFFPLLFPLFPPLFPLFRSGSFRHRMSARRQIVQPGKGLDDSLP